MKAVASASLFVPDPAGGSNNLRFPHKQFYKYFIAKAGWTILYRDSSAVAHLLGGRLSKSKTCDVMLSEPISVQYLYEIVRDNIQPFRRVLVTMIVLWAAMADKLYRNFPMWVEYAVSMFVIRGVRGINPLTTAGELIRNPSSVVGSEISASSESVKIITSSAQQLYVLCVIIAFFYSKLFGISFIFFDFKYRNDTSWNYYVVVLFSLLCVLMILNLIVASASIVEGKAVTILRIMVIFKLYGLLVHEPALKDVIRDVNSAIWAGCRAALLRKPYPNQRVARAERASNQGLSEESELQSLIGPIA